MTSFAQGHALVVGAGGDLPDTTSDATGVASILWDPARCAYPRHQVHLLTGEQATRAALLAALSALAKTTDARSTLIVYFSGHGTRVRSAGGAVYYLLPHRYDLNRLQQTAISGAEFVARLRAIPAQKQLLLLDCCHAGGVGEAKAPEVRFQSSALPPEAAGLLAEGRGRVIVASSQEDELSFAGRPYSAFTLALLEALAGIGVSKRDGYVRATDLALHAREVVPRRTRDRQHPILHFEHADNFALAYYAGGHTQPKGLPFSGQIEIEPEPGAWMGLDQRGQTVDGDQVNVVGTYQGPVEQHFAPQVSIGGQVSGPVVIGDHNTMIQEAGSEDKSAPKTCPHCGHQARPGARFCTRCGRPLDARTVGADR